MNEKQKLEQMLNQLDVEKANNLLIYTDKISDDIKLDLLEKRQLCGPAIEIAKKLGLEIN